MLSPDEFENGITFVLELDAASGNHVRWLETLRGETAKRWYQIYRESDWAALRMEAADVFHRQVSEEEATAVRHERRRCVFIHTDAVHAEELSVGRGSA